MHFLRTWKNRGKKKNHNPPNNKKTNPRNCVYIECLSLLHNFLRTYLSSVMIVLKEL